ncbi:glycosyltransferase family 9 protein [Robbsia andropogonis]|nr:glycosyltransferase family 9 protein [Robbsia andropogonis]
MPHAIGDSMYLMVLLRALLRQGDDLTLIGGVIYPLRAWFPEVPVARWVPDPCDHAAREALLRGFDQIVQMFPRPMADRLLADDPLVAPRLLRLVDLPGFYNRAHVLHALMAAGRQHLGLHASESDVPLDNGMRPPSPLLHREHDKRVVIHPVASNTFKTWDAAKFVRLAHGLRHRGLQPCLAVPPDEASAWHQRAPGIDVVAFAALPDLAAFLYTSGWFIGNDSGIGHLASALDIPTVSVFPRKGLAQRWHPRRHRQNPIRVAIRTEAGDQPDADRAGSADVTASDAPGAGSGNDTRAHPYSRQGAYNVVVLPMPFLPITKLKERYWRGLMPVSRVLAAFDRQRRTIKTPDGPP